jgi:predicted phage terminase large subunit-like protein
MQLRIEDIRRELCRKSFWDFEQYLHPEFFRDDRTHLREVADVLQGLYQGKLIRPDGRPYRKLMINMPPRFGKSFSLINFEPWVLGCNPAEKILSASYNETLSVRFSKSVRDTIEQTRSDGERGVFADIFPDRKIKHGDAAAQIWSLEGQYFNYLGCSFKGTVTGMGGSIGVIDDPIKNREEAYNERVKEEHYLWYKDTFLSRLEEGAIQIINMTRWATNDLCGRILEDQSGEWYVLRYEAMTGGVMLCPELMSEETYLEKKKHTSREIFLANYHQQPVDIEGRLYKTVKTYKELPAGKVRNYTDTADEGDCYLCSICYVEHNKEAYVVDVLYTGAGMEVTEGQTADMLFKNSVNVADIESNNGGKGFARAVDRILKEHHKTNRTVVKWFHQSQNKTARILSQSAWVQEHIYFPEDWHLLWPEFYRDVTTFTKDGRGQKEDAPDVLTGIAEKCGRPTRLIY